jgi:Bacterial SH3 domain
VRRAPGWSAAVTLLSAHLAGSPLHAESLYVIEQLVVAVNSAPDASGERVATLKSGDRVEVLERAGEQVHVRLAGGREGWVRASYLSADEPLRVRLAQRDAEVARLGEELSLLKAQLHTNPAPQLSGAAASGAAGAAGSAPAAVAAVRELPTPPAGSLFNTEERGHPPWAWALAAALIGFGLGFGAGALLLDRHIRRKYGGLRIY